MDLFTELDDDNFVRYAMKYYDNPQCSGVDEFKEDLDKFKYLKRLFTSYHNDGELKERLILNHLIVLFNVFGSIPTVRMLFFQMPERSHPAIKTFLISIRMLPERDDMGLPIDIDRIPLDINIVKRLRNF